MISIITPLLNEKQYIKHFLDHLRRLEGDFELLLVDGGSTDGTLATMEENLKGFKHEVRLIKAKRGRGIQMNRGAEEAKGDIILFLHVDSMIPRDGLILIERAVESKGVVGGGFHQAFYTTDPFLMVISVFGNLRARITQIFFGDYGIFLRKDVFKKIGGFDEILYLEDVELCGKAKEQGKLIQLDSYVVTSPRRYEGKGRIRLTVIYVLALLFNEFQVRPKIFTRYIAD